MRPTAVSTASPELAVFKTPSVSNAWQLGTILKAMALSNSVDGGVRLQIGARVIAAQTNLPLVSGQTLRLQVVETGRTVILQSVGDTVQNDPVRVGIRQNLPRQMPQSPLLANVLGLSKTATPLPAELMLAVTRLVNSMRNADALTSGQGLRLAVQDSGNFLENRLATASTTNQQSQPAALSRDWKAALLRFKDQLTQLQVKLAWNTGSKLPARLAATGQASNPANLIGDGARSASATIPSAISSSGQATTSGSAGNALSAAQAAKVVNLLPAASPSTVAAAPANQTANDSASRLSTDMSAARVANSLAPPLRHALPQPQPLLQPGTLPTDILSIVGELISGSDGALARVRLNQLASIAPDQGNRVVWLLELPVRHADNQAEVVTLRIEKDEEGDDPEKPAAWTADLAFDLGAKGDLRARVALHGGRVAVTFWADADQTRAEVQGKLPQLKTAMEKKQLDVGILTAGTGKPVEAQAPSASLLETSA